MQATQTILPGIHWLGANDRRLQRFENIHPLPHGISYNSYLIDDNKIALLDTVDRAVVQQFMQNLDALLGGRSLDYLVVHHVEPDHGACISQLCRRWPALQIVANEKIRQLLLQFHSFDTPPNFHIVSEGDTLNLGTHTLQFYFAPMVHWPEVMFSYESSQHVLFSADAFGSFKALPGTIFADEMDFEAEFLDEARRYYGNIVGKYGPQVQSALKKLSGVPLQLICPLHGPIWRKNLDWYLEKYSRWSTYTPETQGVLIAYGSMYGHTENAATSLANLLAVRGVKNLCVRDVSKTHHSYLIADAFRYSHFVLAAPTYNMGLFLPMHTFVHDMQALNLQNRDCAIIGNGSWAPASHKLMQDALAGMKDMRLLAEPLLLRSALTAQQQPQLEALADSIAASLSAAAKPA